MHGSGPGIGIGRALLTIAGVAAALAILIAGTGYEFAVWALVTGVLLIAVGALANRVWVAAIPVTAAVVWSVLVATSSSGESTEPTWEFWVVAALVTAVIFALCLMVGVGLRRGARRAVGDENDLTARGRS